MNLHEYAYSVLDGKTIREIAKEFDTPSSTVHYLVTKRLASTDYDLYEKVKAKLKQNREEAPHRGGQAYARKCKGA